MHPYVYVRFSHQLFLLFHRYWWDQFWLNQRETDRLIGFGSDATLGLSAIPGFSLLCGCLKFLLKLPGVVVRCLGCCSRRRTRNDANDPYGNSNDSASSGRGALSLFEAGMEGADSASSEGIFLIPLARVCFDGMQLLSFIVALRMNVIQLRHLHYGYDAHPDGDQARYDRTYGFGKDMCFFGFKCESEVTSFPPLLLC